MKKSDVRTVGKPHRSVSRPTTKFTFAEFFAGGGMARAGLGSKWQCKFANDFDLKKCAAYRQNWGETELKTGDIRAISLADLPSERLDLAWASFPCQDLSLAGNGAGLGGQRSGTYWAFWNLIRDLSRTRRSPEIVALENVCGTLTSHRGKDFEAIVNSLVELDYHVGAFVLDAALFVPQSRPRLFFVATRNPPTRRETENATIPISLSRAYDRLPAVIKDKWVWWDIPAPPTRSAILADIIDAGAHTPPWQSKQETQRLLELMSPLHRSKVEAASRSGKIAVGAVYRRMRRHEQISVQRAEIRLDGLAGCLRTPVGGSSRQMLLMIDGKHIRSRLLSARELARLMGLPETYSLPEKYSDAYHLLGDGVAVPVVRHIGDNLLVPLAAGRQRSR